MIVKPTEMNFSNKNITMILSGLPGTGKTTLALSAPDVLLIDTDEGMCRVRNEHRKDTSICKTYEEILDDTRSAVGHYKTIVIDTCGKLIDYLKDWAIRTAPGSAKKGGGISIQGFGVVKQEFLRLSDELHKNFNVIYVFHEEMQKNNDDVFYSILCEGSAKTLVYQPADLAGHLCIINDERYVGFTPTSQYTAKGAYGVEGLIKVPKLDQGAPNNFLTVLFDNIRKNLAEEAKTGNEDAKKYDIAMKAGKEIIDKVTKPEDVMYCANAIKNLPNALTSEQELKKILTDKAKENGWVYNKTTKQYEAKV